MRSTKPEGLGDQSVQLMSRMKERRLRRGVLFAIEGIDGAGCGTQTAGLSFGGGYNGGYKATTEEYL